MIQPEKPMKVGEIASTFGVDSNTVRNWCKRYADYLSPAAKPAGGGVRLFSSRDFAVLSYIHSGLNGGMNHDEIAVKMAEMSFNDGQVDIIIGLADVLPPEATPTSQEGQGEALAVQVALSTMQNQIEAVQRRLDARDLKAIYEAERRGAAVALVFVGFLLLFAWLLVNGAP